MKGLVILHFLGGIHELLNPSIIEKNGFLKFYADHFTFYRSSHESLNPSICVKRAVFLFCAVIDISQKIGEMATTT